MKKKNLLQKERLRLGSFVSFVLSCLFLETSGNYIFIDVTWSRYNRIGNENVSLPCLDPPPPLPSQSNQKCFIVFIKWFKSIFVSFKRFEFYLLVNQDISAISFNWKLMLLDYNFLKYTNKCFVDIFLF